ncbi:unnamed protein product [Heligmosomoides polygyrus]|uniref:LisH domain-containing protein n=1 Tax=Heligmosomoides polygyrus TaxID=6339 RepID=A0A183FSG1_HELPZ|nr:unnamed protein product [Heligmosomoides polygyrus]
MAGNKQEPNDEAEKVVNEHVEEDRQDGVGDGGVSQDFEQTMIQALQEIGFFQTLSEVYQEIVSENAEEELSNGRMTRLVRERLQERIPQDQWSELYNAALAHFAEV